MSVVIERNNVNVYGDGPTTIIFAHGFGCDQNMWRFLVPTFEKTHRVVIFDYVGSGKSNKDYFDQVRYSELDGFALDIIEICDAMHIRDAIFVGHSVSCMIGLIASIQRPELIAKQIMVCPSPCFLNDPPHYCGGFEREDLEELLSLMDKNYLGWADYLSPLVMGSTNPDLTTELNESFCSTDPVMARVFAEATFLSDCREILPRNTSKTLIIQSSDDALAAVSVGQYMREKMPCSSLEVISAEGHCLHMSHPTELTPVIQKFIG